MMKYVSSKLNNKYLVGFLLSLAIHSTGCLEAVQETKEKAGGGGAASACGGKVADFAGGIDPASATSATTGTISWLPIANCNMIYRIYRVPDLTTPVTTAVGKTAASVNLTGLVAGSTYQYVVRAFDGSQEDKNLKIVNLVMPSPTIGAFTLNSITASTNHKPTFSWTAASNAQTYNLQVAWDPSFSTRTTVLNVTGITSTSYTPSTDIAMGKYWFKVTAVATGTSNVVASNAPLTTGVYPTLTGCMAGYQRTNLLHYNGSTTNTGWLSTCPKAAGMELGYMTYPQGLTLDPSTSYLYIGDGSALSRWDTNSFSNTGFLDYQSNFTFRSFTTQWGNYLYTAMLPFTNYSAVFNHGCSDGTYVYIAGYTKVIRIKIANQTYDGQIGNGLDGWDYTNTSSSSSTGTGYKQFYGAAAVGCNSTDPYLYVADTYNYRISRWNKTTGIAGGVWGQGSGAAWTTAACCTYVANSNSTTGLNYINNLVLSSAGTLYFAEQPYRVARILNLAAPVIDGWICDGTGAGTWSTNTIMSPCLVNGAGASPVLGYYITGLAIDAANNIYIVSPGIKVLAKFSSSGTLLRTFNFNGLDSSPTTALPQSVAVKADGSLIYISDSGAARVMVFDNNFTYLGFMGAGATGLNSSSTSRPATTSPFTASIESYEWGHEIEVDPSTDTLYATNWTYSPAPTRQLIVKHQASTGAFMGDSQATVTTSSSVGAGYAPAYLGQYSTSFKLSKVNNYLYTFDYQNGRINRWDKTNFTYGGWIGNSVNGWQTTTTPTPSTASCSFRGGWSVDTDNLGYMYIFDSWSNRVLVWDETTGNCLGHLGGGNNGLVATLAGQADTYNEKYFSGYNSSYVLRAAILGDYLYVDDTTLQGVVKRYSYDSTVGPSSLTWAGWFGGNIFGWRTTSYATNQFATYEYTGTGFSSANNGPGEFFGSGMFAKTNVCNFLRFNAMGDSSYFGKLFTTSDYSFDTTASSNTYQPMQYGAGHTILNLVGVGGNYMKVGFAYDDSNGILYINVKGSGSGSWINGALYRFH